MEEDWAEAETNKHQDHVVAHVVGATVLGYFAHTDALYMLLDIGFFWIVYLDAEMGLVAESTAISELDADASLRARLNAEADALRREGTETGALSVMRAAPAGCVVEEIALSKSGARRRLFVRGEASSLVIEIVGEAAQFIVEAC